MFRAPLRVARGSLRAECACARARSIASWLRAALSTLVRAPLERAVPREARHRGFPRVRFRFEGVLRRRSHTQARSVLPVSRSRACGERTRLEVELQRPRARGESRRSAAEPRRLATPSAVGTGRIRLAQKSASASPAPRSAVEARWQRRSPRGATRPPPREDALVCMETHASLRGRGDDREAPCARPTRFLRHRIARRTKALGRRARPRSEIVTGRGVRRRAPRSAMRRPDPVPR